MEAKDANPWPFLSFIPQARASVFEEMARSFLARIRNTGLYHYQASGYVEIKETFGKRIARNDIPARYLLPNRNRSFDIDVIQGEQSFWRRNSYFGPYTAQLVLYIPERDAQLIMKEHFWVFPWKTVLVLFAMAIAFLLTRRRIRMAGKALLGKQ